jgi:hypothetical protein
MAAREASNLCPECIRLRAANDAWADDVATWKTEALRLFEERDRLREALVAAVKLMNEARSILEEYSPGHRILINGLEVEGQRASAALEGKCRS